MAAPIQHYTPYPEAEREAIVERVIDALEQGTPLAVACRGEGMPSRSSFYDWIEGDQELSGRIARARDIGFDTIALRTRETARGGGDSKQDVARDKLIVDTDLKLLSKWDPKRYGDRTTIAGDPEAPLSRADTPALLGELAILLGPVILALPAPENDATGLA